MRCDAEIDIKMQVGAAADDVANRQVGDPFGDIKLSDARRTVRLSIIGYGDYRKSPVSS